MENKKNPICKDRKTMLNMGNGIITITIERLNPDTIRGENAERLKKHNKTKIHISSVQETQIPRDREYIPGARMTRRGNL